MVPGKKKASGIHGINPDYKVKDEKREMIFSELNSLLSSGLDFSRSFRLLIDGESDSKVKAVLQRIYDSVVSGSLLWQAVEKCRKFSPLDHGVIRIGEETGRLDESLEFLSTYYKKKTEQRRMVTSALRYPLIVLTVAVVVVIFMMVVIVPMFEQVYSRMGGELPAITQSIIRLSKNFPIWGSVFGVIIISTVALFYIFRQNPVIRIATSRIIMRLPLAGIIVRKNCQSHFCKLLYLLTSSGVPLINGIEMLRTVITFYPYQYSFEHVCDGLKRGELLSTDMEKFPALYEKKLITLVRVGEETNRLPSMFLRQG